jgi:hypothetical protein
VKRRGQSRDGERRPLCYFRNLVYREYREVRHLGSEGGHPKWEGTEQYRRCRELAKKDKGPAEFERLYWQIAKETDTSRILQPFMDATAGLTLEDLLDIFANGEWGPQDRIAYGGPRHARIVDATIRLKDAVMARNWRKAEGICDEVAQMEHYSRPVVQDFIESCDT